MRGFEDRQSIVGSYRPHGRAADLPNRSHYAGYVWYIDSARAVGYSGKGATMSKATYPLKLPLSVKKAAQRLAQEDGVSLNQWIAAAVAEKIGVVEKEFFKKRAGNASGAGLMKFLRHAPDVEPEEQDQVRQARR
jgi:hypothetical protein